MADSSASGLLEIEHRETPPSLNRIGYRSHWSAGRREKMRWQETIWALLMEAGLPRPLDRVTVTAQLRFPTNRRRDEGNFRALLEKCCGDALVAGRWLADDTPDRYRFGECAIESETGPARTVLRVQYQRDERG